MEKNNFEKYFGKKVICSFRSKNNLKKKVQMAWKKKSKKVSKNSPTTLCLEMS